MSSKFSKNFFNFLAIWKIYLFTKYNSFGFLKRYFSISLDQNIFKFKISKTLNIFDKRKFFFSFEMEDQPFISPVQFLREPETRRRLASGSSPYFQNPSSSSSFSSGEKPLNLEKNFPSSRRHTLNDYSPNYIKEPPEILSSQTPLIQSSISSLVNSSYTPRAPPLFHSNSLSRSFSSTPRYQTPLSPNRFSVELIEEQSDSEDEDYPLDQHGSNFKKEETILTPLSLNPENIEKQRAFMEAYEEVHEIIEVNQTITLKFLISNLSNFKTKQKKKYVE